jgi:hypothetical protein
MLGPKLVLAIVAVAGVGFEIVVDSVVDCDDVDG